MNDTTIESVNAEIMRVLSDRIGVAMEIITLHAQRADVLSERVSALQARIVRLEGGVMAAPAPDAPGLFPADPAATPAGG